MIYCGNYSNKLYQYSIRDSKYIYFEEYKIYTINSPYDELKVIPNTTINYNKRKNEAYMGKFLTYIVDEQIYILIVLDGKILMYILDLSSNNLCHAFNFIMGEKKEDISLFMISNSKFCAYGYDFLMICDIVNKTIIKEFYKTKLIMNYAKNKNGKTIWPIRPIIKQGILNIIEKGKHLIYDISSDILYTIKNKANTVFV
jgi:hypothetical protein